MCYIVIDGPHSKEYNADSCYDAAEKYAIDAYIVEATLDPKHTVRVATGYDENQYRKYNTKDRCVIIQTMTIVTLDKDPESCLDFPFEIR